MSSQDEEEHSSVEESTYEDDSSENFEEEEEDVDDESLETNDYADPYFHPDRASEDYEGEDPDVIEGIRFHRHFKALQAKQMAVAERQLRQERKQKRSNPHSTPKSWYRVEAPGGVYMPSRPDRAHALDSVLYDGVFMPFPSSSADSCNANNKGTFFNIFSYCLRELFQHYDRQVYLGTRCFIKCMTIVPKEVLGVFGGLADMTSFDQPIPMLQEDLSREYFPPVAQGGYGFFGPHRQMFCTEVAMGAAMGAAQLCQKDVLHLLLTGFPQIVDEPLGDRTLLHVAEGSSFVDGVKMLLAAKHDPNMWTSECNTPICWAPTLEIATMLVKAGASVKKKEGTNNWGPLDHHLKGYKRTNYPIARLLIENGASFEDLVDDEPYEDEDIIELKKLEVQVKRDKRSRE